MRKLREIITFQLQTFASIEKMSLFVFQKAEKKVHAVRVPISKQDETGAHPKLGSP